MSIPTLVPRDLLPRPEWTALRIAAWSALPVLILFALLVKGVPRERVLVVLVFIAGEASIALAQAQKEMLAAGASYFRPGLRRRVGQAQAFWSLAVPAATATAYGLIAPHLGAAVLLSTFGLTMVVHALLSWTTFRMWWAFQLPTFGFYLFIVPSFIRGTGATDRLTAVAHQPIPWLVGGIMSAWLLVRYASSRALQRRLHDTIVLGPEAIFKPSRVQEYKEHHRRHGAVRGRSGLHGRLTASFAARIAAAVRRGDALGAQRWRLAASAVAALTSERRWVLPLVLIAPVVLMLGFGYLQDIGGMQGQGWFIGFAYQFALAPFYSLGLFLLAMPMISSSRRVGWHAETAALLAAIPMSALIAVTMKLVSDALAAVMPPLDWNGATYAFQSAPLHGVWTTPLAAVFAWLAVAVRPRHRCSLPGVFAILGFFFGYALPFQAPPGLAAAIYGGVVVIVFGIALVLRRRWWLHRDLPA